MPMALSSCPRLSHCSPKTRLRSLRRLSASRADNVGSVPVVELANGLELASLGIGAWAYGNNTYWQTAWDAQAEQSAADAVRVALEVSGGKPTFDTAEAYSFPQGAESSESIIARALGVQGSSASVITKFAPAPWKNGRDAVVNACKKSCERLGAREFVDVYLLHWPGLPFQNDAYLDGLADCVEKGLAKSVGVCNYNAAQVRDAHAKLAARGVPLTINQVQFSLMYTRPLDSGLLDTCRELGVVLQAWSPLGQGLLTGKYSRDNPPPGIRGSAFGIILEEIDPLLAALDEIADTHGGKTKGQVALRWLMDQDGVVTIPGAKNASQAEEAYGALGWSLTADEVARLTSEAAGLKERVRSKGGVPALVDRFLEAGGV
ncbi:aldo/keto reductase [Pycnococcus provasolii]